MIASSVSERFLQSRRTFWIVLSLTIFLFAIGNLPWRLDDYDQAKQAFTSFEIVKEGHWLYQRTPNEHAATKPPLVAWISAALFAGTRSWALAWRLPSFISALALLAFLYFRRAQRLRTGRRPARDVRLRFESAFPAIGYACSNRHAAGAHHFSTGLANLGQDSQERTVGNARSRSRFHAAHGIDADQRPDRLRVLVAGDRDFRMAPPFASDNGECLVRLAAVVRGFRDFCSLGRRRIIHAAFFPRRRDARISWAIWRNRSPAAADLFLFAAPPAQVCAVEHSSHRVRRFEMVEGKIRNPSMVVARIAGDFLAGGLEHRRIGCDVAYSFEAS